MFCNRVFLKCLPGTASWASFWQKDSAQTDWFYQSPDTDAAANPLIASLVIALITQQLGSHCYTRTATHAPLRKIIFTEQNKLTQNGQ